MEEVQIVRAVFCLITDTLPSCKCCLLFDNKHCQVVNVAFCLITNIAKL